MNANTAIIKLYNPLSENKFLYEYQFSIQKCIDHSNKLLLLLNSLCRQLTVDCSQYKTKVMNCFDREICQTILVKECV